MTIVVNPAAVATAISGLTITGVTIKDINAIPDSVQMLCPIIIPQPNGFIGNIEPENLSFGSLGTQAENFTYTLNYVFLFAEIGSGESGFTPYSPLIVKLIAIVNVILNNDVVSGLVDMQLESITGIGQINDPANNAYWGAFFALRCLEFGK